MKIGYHGTSRENKENILKEGFKIDAPLARDPGDWGRGIYFYPHKNLAQFLNLVVLKSEINITNFLKIPHCKIETVRKPLEETIGCPIRGVDRLKISWVWRQHFLNNGYNGLLVKGWDCGHRYEIIVFNLDTIQNVCEVK